MALFRKRPVVIEANRLSMDNSHALAIWAGAKELDDSYDIIIPTLEGDMRATAGDWIIRGLKGEFYPCKPDIFELTYEKA